MTTVTRRVLAGLLGTIGLLALLYVADVAMASGRVPRGTVVGSVEIGGKSKAEARRLIAERVKAPATITVSVPSSVLTLQEVAPGALRLSAKSVGLAVDADETVDRARNEALNPFARLRGMFARHEIQPAASVDDRLLRREITEWARAEVERNPREAYVVFDGGEPIGVPPLRGRRVDVERTAAAVVEAFPDDADVDATVAVVEPKTTAEDLTRAIAEVAEPAIAAPVTLTGGGKTVTVPGGLVGEVILISTDPDGQITAKVAEKNFEKHIHPLLKPFEKPAKDAPITADEKTGKITIGRSAKGTEVDREALAAAFVPAILQPAPRTIALSIVDAEPRVSTELAKTLGIKEKVGEFTTYHPCCRPRVRNIHLMADIVEGAVVLPGETFSLNGHVGERDRARGFVEAPMILNGKFVPAVGGGVSQFATTMFNAVFFGGFQDVYHKPHSYYISRYPPGREATVSSPAPDLKWRNDSKYGVLITTSYTEKSITVTFWSTKRYDIESITGERYRYRSFGTQYDYSPTCTSTSGVPGFDIDVWRVFKVKGKEVRREKFHTRYLPEPRFICR